MDKLLMITLILIVVMIGVSYNFYNSYQTCLADKDALDKKYKKDIEDATNALTKCNNSFNKCQNDGMGLFMYGPHVTEGPVKKVVRNNDGSMVYMVEDGPYTKMIINTGQTKYYQGNVDSFDYNKWSTYDGGADYRLRLCPLKCSKGCDEKGDCKS